jgi:hypothetical protein
MPLKTDQSSQNMLLNQGSELDFSKRGNFCQKRGKLKEKLEFLRRKSGEKGGIFP